MSLLLSILTVPAVAAPCFEATVEEADVVIAGTDEGALAGRSVALVGDLDLDLSADLLVGASGVDGRGAVYTITALGGGLVDVVGDELRGSEAGADAGASVAAAGDLDGNGLADFAASAPLAGGGAGEVYVFYGPLFTGGLLTDALGKVAGSDPGQLVGQSLAAVGDVTGDGRDDLLIGVPGDGSAGEQAGAAWLFTGPIYGTKGGSQARAVLRGEDEEDRAGWSVAGPGDLTGDGVADLLIGAPYADEAGAAYVVAGPVSGNTSLADAYAVVAGAASTDRLGWSVAGAGDVNGDGRQDLLVGVPQDDTAAEDAGAALLFLGPVSGRLTAEDADARLLGTAEGDRAGWSVAGAGDVNGDGYDDLLVGGPFASGGGAAWLVLGPVRGDVGLEAADGRLVGVGDEDRVGWAVAGGRDLDGDAQADLLIGATGYGGEATLAGGAFVVFGPGCAAVSDVDRDGYDAGDDCDDTDAAVHPGATEDPCNGVDDDCDGSTDEGDPDGAWYADGDGDGFGAGEPVTACTVPEGHAAAAGDCDDADAKVFPDAEETCNGVDDDCDGEVDEGCAGSFTDELLRGCERRGAGGTWSILLLPLLGMRRRRG